ncbi:NAD(P)/FAD-dependent oxidoreductase [Maribacter aestuarii]|uniref:NAD(P)/FAD-dependent oxidoreductase n=1 Tax=Maribacter aestuarii TaxID=1130723 RepID=UPI00248CB3A7|nr:FAD-dependent oxidoreductase [Maribacter aestuarii]
MVDYLVVGLGLAGTSFCETLYRNNKSFVVFNDDSQTSSLVAGGLYNPVILKRFTLSWNAEEQLAVANEFYPELESRLGTYFDDKIPVLRRFVSTEEQNLWFEASDKPHLKQFLSTKLISNKNAEITASKGYGQVLYTGRMDTVSLLSAYKDWLIKEGLLELQTFDYDELQVNKDFFNYKNINAKHIVFAEGYGLKHNPFFNYLPMQGSKGEYLIIRARGLKEITIIKSSIFLIPLGDDLYKVGATYNREDKTNVPTTEAKKELLRKLKDLINCEFDVVDQLAGIRPTVKDRRPLIGEHPVHKRIWLLNGFGSHGVMIGPWAAKKLYNYIEKDIPLDKEMDIDRFRKEYKNVNSL